MRMRNAERREKTDETECRTTTKGRVGVEAIPEEEPVISDLKEAFGDHTYFLDANGLNIVEPNVFPESSIGNVVKIASWSSDEQTELLRHEPEVLPITVDLESDEPDRAT